MAGSKTRLAGQLLELEFALECISRGAIVSQPFGDNAHYDLLIDNGRNIVRIQVKKSSRKKGSQGYFVNIKRRLPKGRPLDPGGSSRRLAYEKDQIDFIATKALGSWFFFGKEHLDNDATVYPESERDAYMNNHGKDKWEMIGLGSKSEL